MATIENDLRPAMSDELADMLACPSCGEPCTMLAANMSELAVLRSADVDIVACESCEADMVRRASELLAGGADAALRWLSARDVA